MATLQVKGMDDRLYAALTRRAKMDNRSISQEVVTIIQEFLSRPRRNVGDATDEFLKIAGTWNDSRSATDIAGEIRKSRHIANRISGSEDVFD